MTGDHKPLKSVRFNLAGEDGGVRLALARSKSTDNLLLRKVLNVLPIRSVG